MPDINNITLWGRSEGNTIITNNGNSHTFTWIPATPAGNNVQNFNMSNISITNTAVGYHAIHIDANNIVYPNSFFGYHGHFSKIDVTGNGSGTAIYLRNCCNFQASDCDWIGGDTVVKNCSTGYFENIIFGNSTPNNLDFEFLATNPMSFTRRGEVSLIGGAIIKGDLILRGHPNIAIDPTVNIAGNITGIGLTSYYSTGIDYCPKVTIGGGVGDTDTPGSGAISLTLPDPQPSPSTSNNFIDVREANVLGTVSISKPTSGPLADSRAYAIINARGTTFGTPTSSTLTLSGYVNADLRNALFYQDALSGDAISMVDRNRIVLPGVNTTSQITNMTISPAFPTGATYTMLGVAQAAVTVYATNKTTSGYVLNRTGAASATILCDIVINRA